MNSAHKVVGRAETFSFGKIPSAALHVTEKSPTVQRVNTCNKFHFRLILRSWLSPQLLALVTMASQEPSYVR